MILIIFGGRNEKVTAFNDFHVLNLNSLNWIQVNMFPLCNDSIIIPRYNHVALINNQSLVIFGGINKSGSLMSET